MSLVMVLLLPPPRDPAATPTDFGDRGRLSMARTPTPTEELVLSRRLEDEEVRAEARCEFCVGS